MGNAISTTSWLQLPTLTSKTFITRHVQTQLTARPTPPAQVDVQFFRLNVSASKRLFLLEMKMSPLKIFMEMSSEVGEAALPGGLIDTRRFSAENTFGVAVPPKYVVLIERYDQRIAQALVEGDIEEAVHLLVCIREVAGMPDFPEASAAPLGELMRKYAFLTGPR
jgi:hypothetical protein